MKVRTAPVVDVAFIVLLGALAMLPPLSTDIMLPGLPVIGRALHASSATVQHSLSIFLFTFGAGQLVLGPISDRWGRRPVLLAGLILFALGALACTLATNGTTLVVARAVQGLGACAGTMSARAIVQDVSSDRNRAASLQAFVSAVTSVAPIVAPLIGAGILATLGWRPIYGVLVVTGLLLAAIVAVRLPETAPGTTARGLSGYARVLRLPRTVPLACFIALSFGAYFTMISGSPFALVTQMHVASGPYAAAFAVNACALLAGSFVAARLTQRIGAERLFAGGVALSFVAAILACALDVAAPSPAGFVATFALYAFAFGVLLPNAYAAGLAPAGADAGTASAVLGATQMIGGGAASALAAALPIAPSSGTGLTVLCTTALAGAAYLLSRRGLAVRG